MPQAFERPSLIAAASAKCYERQGGDRSTHAPTLVSAVVRTERHHSARGEKSEDHEGRNNRKVIKASLRHRFHLLSELEANVLQGLGSVPKEARSRRIVAAPHGEIPLRYPGGGPVTGRRELVECLLRGPEFDLGLVEAVLLEHRASEDELSVADLIEEIDPIAEELERVPRLFLGALDVAGS